MVKLTKSIQEEVPWYMLFVDDIVFGDETKHEVNVKLEIWHDDLESEGVWISWIKTKYMECKLSKTRNKDEGAIRLDDQEKA